MRISLKTFYPSGWTMKDVLNYIESMEFNSNVIEYDGTFWSKELSCYVTMWYLVP